MIISTKISDAFLSREDYFQNVARILTSAFVSFSRCYLFSTVIFPNRCIVYQISR